DRRVVDAAALPGVAVTLDQPRALGDLDGDVGREMGGLGDEREPRRDRGLLLRPAMAARAQALEPGQRPEAHVAGERGALDLHAPVRVPAAPLRQPGQARRERRREDLAKLLEAGLEDIDDAERLAVLEAELLADARKTLRRDLRLGDPDNILERHAHCELPRALANKPATRAGAVVRLADRLEPIYIEARIGRVLVGRGAPQALHHDLDRRSRQEGVRLGPEPRRPA